MSAREKTAKQLGPISEVSAEILASLKTAFDAVSIATEYPRVERDTKRLPAIFFELVSMRPTKTQENQGHLNMTLSWEARIFTAANQAEARLSARELALNLVLWLDDRRLARRSTPTRVLSAYDEGPEPSLQALEVFTIEFEFERLFEKEAIKETLYKTRPVWVGFTPYVGAEHVAAYEEVKGD